MDIQLTHPHTHAGKDYPAGTVIDVSDTAAAWLIDHQRGQRPMDVPQRKPDDHVINLHGRKRRPSKEDTHHGE